MDSFALITGSSSGIGLEIAKSLAKRGHNLILTARREALLEKYAKEISNNFNVKVKFIAVDLGLTGAPQEIFEFCEPNPIRPLKRLRSLRSGRRFLMLHSKHFEGLQGYLLQNACVLVRGLAI